MSQRPRPFNHRCVSQTHPSPLRKPHMACSLVTVRILHFSTRHDTRHVRFCRCRSFSGILPRVPFTLLSYIHLNASSNFEPSFEGAISGNGTHQGAPSARASSCNLNPGTINSSLHVHLRCASCSCRARAPEVYLLGV